MRGSELAERIAALPGPALYRRVEVAAALGVSPTAISELYGRRPEFVPKQRIEHHGQDVYLWTDAEVEKLREHFERTGGRPGRPRIWSVNEARERERARQQVRGLTQRASKARDAGKEDRAAALFAEAQRLRAALVGARTKRIATQPARPPSPREVERRQRERELRRLRTVETEYRTTLLVLALVVERMLAAKGGAVVVITDAELADPPDLVAHRSPERGAIFLRAER